MSPCRWVRFLFAFFRTRGGVFIVIFVGIILACITLAVEYCWFKVYRRRDLEEIKAQTQQNKQPVKEPRHTQEKTEFKNNEKHRRRWLLLVYGLCFSKELGPNQSEAEFLMRARLLKSTPSWPLVFFIWRVVTSCLWPLFFKGTRS